MAMSSDGDNPGRPGLLRSHTRSGSLVGSFFTRLSRQHSVSADISQPVGHSEALPAMPNTDELERRYEVASRELGLSAQQQQGLSQENKWKIVLNFERAGQHLQQPEDYARTLQQIATGPVEEFDVGIAGFSSRAPQWLERFAGANGTRSVLLILQRLLGERARAELIADCVRALRELVRTTQGRAALEDDSALGLMLRAVDYVGILGQVGLVGVLLVLGESHRGYMALLHALDTSSGDGGTHWQRLLALLDRENNELRCSIVKLCDLLLSRGTVTNFALDDGTSFEPAARRLREALTQCDLGTVLREMSQGTEDARLLDAIQALCARHSEFALDEDDGWTPQRARRNAQLAFDALKVSVVVFALFCSVFFSSALFLFYSLLFLSLSALFCCFLFCSVLVMFSSASALFCSVALSNPSVCLSVCVDFSLFSCPHSSPLRRWLLPGKPGAARIALDAHL